MRGKRFGQAGRQCLTLLLLAMIGILAGCSDAVGSSIDTTGYPDPPEDEWQYTLTIYWSLDIMGGDSPKYSFDKEGIVEEGSREDPNAAESDSGIEIFEATPPGGRDFYFHGVAPGDVVLSMRNEKKGKTTYECKYVLRVTDDLRLAVLDVIES